MVTKAIISLLLLAASAAALPARERFDGIVAVVGDSVILQSELDAYIVMRETSMGAKLDTSRFKSLRKQLVGDLVDGKVLIVHAAKDSTIVIKENEVEQAVAAHVSQILSQNNLTMDELEKELREKYGMGLTKFKAQLRSQIQEQLIKQKVSQQYVGQVSVSKNDVETFYREFKDSLPTIGESVLLSKVVLRLTTPDSLRQSAYAKAKNIKRRLDEGGDFAAIAKQFSEDPNAENGGDLGFIGKGTLSELKFEEAVFSLNVGQTSDIIESRLGFHIVNVLEKKDQKVHIRQIFVSLTPPEAEVRARMALLDSVRLAAKTRADFIDAVKKFSTDPQTKTHDGRVGWVPLFGLSEAARAALDSLPVGGIAAPLREGNEVSLYRIDDRMKNRPLTLEDDFDLLSEKAKEIMAQKKLLDLVRKWRREVYVDIRL
jgi:peptidyl-prolyl cis-trans isomerase SurA